MPAVVTLNDSETLELRRIVMDKDAEAALSFLKNRILKRLDESQRKGMDTGKGHL
jgi:hypothetical protein